mgnify:CR=1 FL=1
MAVIKKFRIKSFKEKETLVELNKVSMFYNKRQILNDLNLKINRNEVLGMLGPNGVGKSTIFHIITGLNRLGPEPFSKEFNITYFRECLKGRKRSIKATLLDQSIVAGIGNIYADESLFSAGISPFREARTIKKNELKKLKIAIVNVLKKSIGEGGTTFSDFRDLEGINGNYGGQAWVYRRSGKNCRKCGGKILREKICGRSTHWCPNCQK